MSLLLLWCCAASAQSADGIGTSVTRTVTLTPDEATFSVIAGASLDTTQQQVAQIFQDAGIASLPLTGTSLGQVQNYSVNPPTSEVQVFYQFTFTVPATTLKDVGKALEALRAKPPALLKSMQYLASLNASTTTVDAAHQAQLPLLIADAQKKAQSLAAAAGLKLGGIKGLNESFYSSGNVSANWISSSSFIGGFSTNSNGGTQYSFYAAITFNVAAQ